MKRLRRSSRKDAEKTQINLRVTRDEKERLKRAANRHDRSLSAHLIASGLGGGNDLRERALLRSDLRQHVLALLQLRELIAEGLRRGEPANGAIARAAAIDEAVARSQTLITCLTALDGLRAADEPTADEPATDSSGAWQALISLEDRLR